VSIANDILNNPQAFKLIMKLTFEQTFVRTGQTFNDTGQIRGQISSSFIAWQCCGDVNNW